MKKVPTMFERDWEGDRSKVLNVPNPECDWVFKYEGIATIKLDGTCCMIRDGKLFKRLEVKQGKTPPSDFEQVNFDEKTGETVGWVPVTDTPENRWHLEALNKYDNWTNGTYELIGPKIQGNPEHWHSHALIRHGVIIPDPPPREFDALREWLKDQDIEGLVFHHPDGRMAKIKLRDFGLKRIKKL